DSGDLIINGTSTTEYRDKHWDRYRNHSVGFVFQTYNLIPHQTVLANVELALTLSGVGSAERKKRALDALDKVGIRDQAKKKPNQLSGGQMQRVAIARALVNDPAILLADEPTGALDSATSVQIMDILREVASDRLVIMVTHNPDLAEQYATRTVNLRDGEIVSDSLPFDPPVTGESAEKERPKKEKDGKRTSMSFFTALSLSLNNLMTKKARTILTSFAGSIGIIGIALILSLKSGFETYINRVQEDTLSTYPITVESAAMDLTSVMEELADLDSAPKEEHDAETVYSRPIYGKLINAMLAGIQENDLESFRAYIEENRDQLDQYTNDIKYAYGVNLCVYTENADGEFIKVNPLDSFDVLYGRSSGASLGGSSLMSMGNSSYRNSNVWGEIIDNAELLRSQYDVYGRLPESYNEVVLFVSENNEITDFNLCGLGLEDQKKVIKLLLEAIAGQKVSDEEVKTFSYSDILDMTFTMIPTAAQYEYNAVTGLWEDRGDSDEYMRSAAQKYGETIKIVGILRPNESAVATSATTAIGYTHALTEHYIRVNNALGAVQRQISGEINEAATAKYGKEYRNDEVDIFTGIPFDYVPEKREVTMDDVNAYISSLPAEQQEKAFMMMQGRSEEEIIAAFSQIIRSGDTKTDATLESNLALLGAAELEVPSSISFYAKDFAGKEALTQFINDYNTENENAGRPEKVIRYTDYIGLFLSSVSTIIDTISYVLIAFVSISLIVSSIMIGVITYISVLERTKEIGILRSIGASRRDISRVFNAETFLVGSASGLIGILVTVILNIPINAIIYSLSGINGMAWLPPLGGAILVAISMILTVVAGLIPSGMASRRDPVVALRTE
ncbi:MAG: ABC transporter ATP-binding protein/permease, partial [Clostridia bacterium]|nr:ABC transporter ATP-binding protein/permease [Clostridia bacterium]